MSMSIYHNVKKEKPLESDKKLLMAVPSEKFSRRNLIKTGGGGDYRNNNNDQGNQSKYVTSLRQFGQNLSCEKKFKQLISNLLQGFF